MIRIMDNKIFQEVFNILQSVLPTEWEKVCFFVGYSFLYFINFILIFIIIILIIKSLILSISRISRKDTFYFCFIVLNILLLIIYFFLIFMVLVIMSGF